MASVDEHAAPRPTRVRDLDNYLPVLVGFEGNRVVLRTMFRIVGTALILAAPAMWVLPGSLLEQDVAVMKFLISVFFLFCGLALLMRNHVDTQPEVYFDPIRREMRVLQKNDKGRPETVMRRSYDSLGGARITRTELDIWELDGTMLMQLSINDPDVRHALRMQLSGLVNLSC